MVQVRAWKSALEWWKKLSWRSLRFPILFFVSVAVLTLVYRLRSDRIDKEEAEKALLVTKAVLTVPVVDTKKGRFHGALWPDDADLSEVHERWVVVSGTEEGGGRRHQGGAAAACTLAAVAKAKGWRPIVIGEELKCCRLPDCVPFDSALLSRLPYRVLHHASSIPPRPPRHTAFRPSPLRNAAFLFAIQHGARFVFDAYPPRGDNESLHAWAEEVFSSMALGTSVGIVLDGYSYSFPTSVPGAPAPRVLNPYAHFGRPDLWPKGYEVRGDHQDGHLRYRVCEIRQPSVEMFLDVWDGGPADLVAPPVTVPISVLAPYASRNVLYTRDAFWGLALLPPRRTTNGSSSPQISPYLARSLWNHALLGATSDSGGVRFSLVPGTEGIHSNWSNSIFSRIPLEEEMSVDTSAYIATFTSRVLRWRCRCTTLLPCLSQLASDFLATSLLTPEDAAFLEAWVTDLRRVRYLPPPTLPWAPRPPPRPTGPCVHPPHHHHRQSHDPPLPHPTTLTFHPVHFTKSTSPTTSASFSLETLLGDRDAALLEWLTSNERTKEEVSVVEKTLAEDHMLTDSDAITEVTSESDKIRQANHSQKVEEVVVVTESKRGEDESTIQEQESTEKTGEGSNDSTEVPQPNQEEFVPSLARDFLADIAEQICPGFSPLVSSATQRIPFLSSTALDNVLLVVWFPRPPRYDLLPTLELLRLRHFPNALFCGPPHRALPAMLSRFDSQNSPSFLTATSRSDCLLTALEMGYRVGEEGSVLLVEESALPVPWNLAQMNRSLVWFHAEKTGGRNKRSPDLKIWETSGGDHGPRSGHWKVFNRGQEESVIMAAEGLASSLRFLARLMGVRPNPHLHPHHHPIDDVEHEESNWGRAPVNVTSAPNVTESTTLGNNTTNSSVDAIELTTVTEIPIVLTYNESHTSEVPQVEVVAVSNGTESSLPSVEHADTSSIEYSEPSILEYSEPKLINDHKIHEVAEITEPIIKHGNDSHTIETLDAPAISYHEPTSQEHLESLELDEIKIETVSDPYYLDRHNDTETETMSDELDMISTVATQDEDLWNKDGINATTTEWPISENNSALSQNDSHGIHEPLSNLTSSDWTVNSGDEEGLPTISISENTSENNTEVPYNDDDGIVTEYLVENLGMNMTFQPNEETGNTTQQKAFEMKDSELYEEEKDKEDSLVDGEQSLIEEDSLLSYKDVEDSPQFISLPSAVSKSHSKSIEEPVGVSISTEAGERKKRDAILAEGLGQYAVDGIREQSKKSKESGEDLGDELRASNINPRLSRSLHEIEELFSELVREFPEDNDAVLKEKGNPDILRYPTKHYGLDHTDFRHLHCDYGEEEDDVKDRDWGDHEVPHFEPCTVLRRFFLRLHHSHPSTNSMLNLLSLAITRGSAPIFHLPMRLQRELHLTASLLLSQGFPEEAVLPLLVYGLAGENGWVNLERGSFLDSGEGFPEFDNKANFIHPTNLRQVPEEPRLRSVFCLKFLLRILEG